MYLHMCMHPLGKSVVSFQIIVRGTRMLTCRLDLPKGLVSKLVEESYLLRVRKSGILNESAIEVSMRIEQVSGMKWKECLSTLQPIYKR
jgi:hypothetical protein